MAAVNPVSPTIFSNTFAPEGLGANTTPATAQRTNGLLAGATPQDQFTPSNAATLQATAEAAGLFTVTQPTAFTPATGPFLAQALPAVSNGPTNTATANGAASPGVAALQPVATNVVGANPGAAASAAPAAGEAGAATAVAAVPGSPAVEAQIQTLNSALQALGLSAADISKVDQIATVLNDFSPTAYASLAYQLVALAHHSAQQTAAAAPNAVGTGPAATGTSPAAAGALAAKAATA
jgi:hypothetical protein